MVSKTSDTVEYIEGSLVQHGPLNDRMYLMKLGDRDPEKVAARLVEKAMEAGYSKIFAKVPNFAESVFLNQGFQVEARVPGFYNGRTDAAFLGFYVDRQRARDEHALDLDNILDACWKHPQPAKKELPAGFSLRRCTKGDVVQIADIYSAVFPTYPFPIDDPSYIDQTMKTHVDYFGIEVLGQLVALSSAETDIEAENVEMTDFATLPSWRGYGLAIHLLLAMEDAMRVRKIKTAYTIARSASAGINITFAKTGYRYAGRVTNNTNICGRIESMNIWHKQLL
ncbi:MAG TPA: putative beta-lysine N-acetyltransferase [Deltaproteobacteria bacterium]|jgi:putative beta-lysine N-acetyltransferase|nr:putative beta-lysine N-acetyltransferase [Deltaproteobacteria bacterium]